MRSIIIKLIKILLPILGVATVDSCIGRVEYGCPYADFHATGNVSDEDDKAIQGIRVVVSAENPGNYTGEPITDTVWTNHSGNYYSNFEEFAYVKKVTLEFEDIDGPENGGEFQKVEIEVPVTQYKDGEGWYNGGFKSSADVTMLKK